jgi:hypothetical protein
MDFGHERAMTSRRVTRNHIEEGIRAGLRYLCRHMSASGRFDYLYDSIRLGRAGRYNLVRHAGTTEIMFRLADSPYSVSALGESADRAWRYLQPYLKVSGSSSTAICVVEDGVAALGATALSLLALTSKLKTSSARASTEDLRVAESMARYLLSQQHCDGSFTCHFDVTRGVGVGSASRYYPGESVLVLCAAFSLARDGSFLAAASRGATYLVSSVAEATESPPLCDHWLMMALGALCGLTLETRRG